MAAEPVGFRWRRQIVHIAAGILLIVAGIVIWGWLIRSPRLIGLTPVFAAMKFNTAVAFAATGAGALLLLHGRRRSALLCALLISAIGAATSFEYLCNANFGIDELFAKQFAPEPVNFPGRMSPISAALFVIIGGALALLSLPAAGWRYMIAGLLSAVVAGIGLSGLIGYATHTSTYDVVVWGQLTRVALHTSLSFIVTGVALGTLASYGEQRLPQWLPVAAGIAGLVCTSAVGMALSLEGGLEGRAQLLPQIVILLGTTLSLLLAVSLRSAGTRAVQRDRLALVLEQRERVLVESSRLAAIVRATSDAILSTNSNSEVVTWNRGAEELYGYRADEIIGRSVELLVPPELLAEFDAVREQLRRGIEIKSLRTERIRKDGERVQVDVSFSPMLDENGIFIGAAVIAVDITKRIESERLITGMLESAPDAIVIVDAAGCMIVANPMAKRLFGYSQDELIGHPVEMLVPAELRDTHSLHRDKYLTEHVARPMGSGRELSGARRDGTHFPVEISLSELRMPNRTLVMSIIRDISARKAAERQLLESLHEKELLLKEVHHRVKNNLQVVSSLLALQAEAVGDARLQGILDDCRSRVASMALVHEKLYGTADLSRIDLAELAHELAASLAGGIERPAARIRLEFDCEPVLLDIDRAVPASLILNELITNALKHAFVGREHGRLQIMVRRLDDTVVIGVTDDGVGGFGADGRAERTTTSLGMTIVRNLVRQLDAKMSIVDHDGTSFRVVVPDTTRGKR